MCMSASMILFFKEGEDRDTIRKAFHSGINQAENWELRAQIVTAAKRNLVWVKATGQAVVIGG